VAGSAAYGGIKAYEITASVIGIVAKMAAAKLQKAVAKLATSFTRLAAASPYGVAAPLYRPASLARRGWRRRRIGNRGEIKPHRHQRRLGIAAAKWRV